MVTRLARTALLFAALVAPGCNLLIGIGDHEPYEPDAGRTSSAGGSTTSSASGGGGSGGAGGTGGEAGSAPACDLPAPTLVASGLHKPGAIVADATTVFWVEESDGAEPGRVVRADRDGANAKPLITGLSNPVGLRIFTTGTALFFSNDTGGVGGGPVGVGVFRMPKDGGAASRISVDDGLGSGLLLLSNGVLYSEAWSQSAPVRVRRTAPGATGNEPPCYPVTAGSNGGRIDAMHASDDRIYFTTEGSTTIQRAAADCDSAPTVFHSGTSEVRAMTSDSTYLFWITPDTVYRLEKLQPNEAPLSIATGFDDLVAIAPVVGGLVVASGSAGTITRVNPTTRTELACGQGSPYRIAVHSGVAFWTNRASGEVRSVVLPE